ncbi:ribosomal oxygenase 2 [Aulostomus maculatus]
MPKKNKSTVTKRRSSSDEQLPVKQSREEAGDAPSPLSFTSPASLFESLIQPMGVEQFFKEFWEKKPLHLQRSNPSTVSYYPSLFRLSDLQSLCSQGLQYYRDVNVVCCINGKKKVLTKDGQVKHGVLMKNLFQNKATCQFHQPQRFKDELWRIQEKLECFFGALVGSNVYITPQESQGLPAHYDDVEVFILQLEGRKRWRLYTPTVPLAAEYSVVSQEQLGIPTHDIMLEEGDLLYLPRGTIHQANTPAGVNHSTHLTLSTYQKMSWGDLLLDTFPSVLFDSSRNDVSLREGMCRRLLLGNCEGQDASKRLAVSLRSLADGLDSGMLQVRSTHMKRDFIMNRLPPHGIQEQLLTPSGRIPALEDTVVLKFKDHMLITVEPSQERTDEATELVVFVLHSLRNQREKHMMGEGGDEEEEQDTSSGVQFPLSHLQALLQLQQAEQLEVAQLQLPTTEAKLSLVLALWSESLLHVL